MQNFFLCSSLYVAQIWINTKEALNKTGGGGGCSFSSRVEPTPLKTRVSLQQLGATVTYSKPENLEQSAQL